MKTNPPIAAALAFASAAALSAAVADRPPNIVLIQCDDLGWDDLALHGNPWVQTPNLDKLGRQSVRFNDFTVNPTCAPTRAATLTGRHFLRTGVSHVHGGKDFLHLSERTLAQHLGAAGYATGAWGKWHLGITTGYLPWDRGFDEAYVADLYRHRNTSGLFNGTRVAHAKWADEVIVDYAIDFISRNRERPFFAYLPTLTPHSRHDAPDEWIQFYQAQGLSLELARVWAMVSKLDQEVGRLLRELESLELLDQTIVIFKSDNGPAIDASTLSDHDRALRKVSNRRGWKGDLFENGVRSPLFIMYRGTLTPRVIDLPIDVVDLAPTLLQMAGAHTLPDTPPFDGRSFLPLMASQEPFKRSEAIFNYAHRGWLTSGPPYSMDGIPGEYLPIPAHMRKAMPFDQQVLSIRNENYKLVLNGTFSDDPSLEHIELFDLTVDPEETTNIAQLNPELSLTLLGDLRSWWASIVNEPHAFAAPIFQLTTGTNSIPARAPATVKGDVFNSVIDLKGWNAKGDAAGFNFNLDVASEASISLHWRQEMPGDTQWSLVVPETHERLIFNGEGPVQMSLPSGRFKIIISLVDTPETAQIPYLQSIAIDIPTKGK
ncbi:MAG: sulfatase-like hydrolase/transferase [Verrucomicrobia bacterium]|nr:sulfatase-like hydrolase/transferase [Verrucomicrobiota bacterium]